MRFLLTVHRPNWLWNNSMDVPLFVSHRQLRQYKNLHPATVPGWALDSGGFTELSMHGKWTISPAEYVAAVARYQSEIGRLMWAAPQDWMCEKAIIDGRPIAGRIAPGTGLSVEEHQDRTVENFLELTALWPGYSDGPCPFIPVIQGDPDDMPGSHIRCTAKYGRAVRLNSYPVVGIGSVCRQQADMATLFRAMRLVGRAHGFGVKTQGLAVYGAELASADSAAWSLNARMNPPMPGHDHRSCNNCPGWALAWRDRVVANIGTEPVPLPPVPPLPPWTPGRSYVATPDGWALAGR